MRNFILIGLLLVTGRSLWADGQLVNGSFSSPPVAGVESFYGNSSIPGWTIIRGSVDVVNLASQPGYAGGFRGYPQAADLNGYIGYTPKGCAAVIYQDVPTTPGRLYTYTFGLAANTGGPPRKKRLKIFWGNANESLALVKSYASSSAAFTTYRFTVRARSSLSRLELVSTTNKMSSYGPYICFSAERLPISMPRGSRPNS